MEEIHLAPTLLTTIGGFPLTNTLLVAVIVSIAIMIVAHLIVRRLTTIPTGGQLVAETIVGGMYNLLHDITGKDSLTRKYFPFAMTLVLFFIVGNLLDVKTRVYSSNNYFGGIYINGYFNKYYYCFFTSIYERIFCCS